MIGTLYERMGGEAGITQLVDDILGAMDKNKMGKEEEKEVLAFVWSLKDDIIRL